MQKEYFFASDLMPKIKNITFEFMEKVKRKYPHNNFKSHFEGCTQEEIKELMDIQEVAFLPPLYQDFLLYLGKVNGGVVLFNVYNEIKHLKKSLINTLQLEDASIKLPNDAFVITLPFPD